MCMCIGEVATVPYDLWWCIVINTTGANIPQCNQKTISILYCYKKNMVLFRFIKFNL